MRCIGFTKELKRCKKTSSKPYCHKHRFQFFSILFSFVGLIGLIAGLLQDVYFPIRSSKKSDKLYLSKSKSIQSKLKWTLDNYKDTLQSGDITLTIKDIENDVTFIASTNVNLDEKHLEPGALIFPLIAIEALNEKVVLSSDSFDISDFNIDSNTKIRNSGHLEGKATLQDIVSQSINSGIVRISQKINCKMIDFFKKYELLTESEAPIKDTTYFEYYSAIGYKVNTTPLRLINSYQNIIFNKNGRYNNAEVNFFLRTLNKVTINGTGRKLDIEYYGAMTSTTLIKDSLNFYGNHLYRNAFIAVYPIYDPKYIMLITIDNPHYQIYSGANCPPIIIKIHSDIIKEINTLNN